MVLLSTLVYFQVFHCQFQVNCRVRQINKLVLLSRRTKEDRRDSEKQVFIFIKTKKLHSCWCFYCCTSGIGKFQMVPAYFIVCFLFSHLLLPHSAEEQNTSRQYCPTFQCGKFGKIGFPFTNASKPECGLFMVDNCTSHPKINLGGKWYEVKSISQGGSIIIHGPEFLQGWKSCNPDSLNKKFTLPRTTFYYLISPSVTLFKCNHSLNISLSTDFNQSHCNNDSTIYYNYLNRTLPTLPPQCSFIQLPLNDSSNQIYSADPLSLISEDIPLEVHVSQECYRCNLNGGQCQDDLQGKFHCANATDTRIENGRKKFGLKLALGASAAGMGVLMFLIYFLMRIKFSSNKSPVLWKKETQNHRTFVAFLKDYGSLAPKRYSYSDVKKMTYSFKHKLDQGGYGGVYKGKLQNGRLVAVKVLNNSKGDGQEFFNEVASIIRTSHVNIVTLLGFCFEGSKRALIYEFMPNGSLEKFIYDENPLGTNHRLGWETLYQIAIGIARGLEYLHRGCNTQILHFDIKPHNILLDEDLCPKISDFGLAKLCPGKQSIISMLDARGTAGYIAPEVFCRSFGGVSHKSDVYSYGMMVLEMVGGRKNIDVGVNHTSQIYFPHWIHKRLEHGGELGLHGIMNEEENEKARKMILVGLWCIQTNPSNRPRMCRVLDMLQGSFGSLQIPTCPFLSSPPRSPVDSSTTPIVAS